MASFQFGTPPLSAGTAAQSSRVFRTTPGPVNLINVTTGAAAGWVLLRDATTEAADGAVTPLLAWQVAANTTLDRSFDPPLLMATGCVLTFSTTGPTTQTKSATAFFGGRIV